MTPSLFLFDDGVAASWEPFALTRPIGELLFGAFLMRERAERYWGAPCVGQVATQALMGFSEAGAPRLVPPGDIAALADALATLAGDAELRARLGGEGRRRFTERFRHQTMTRLIRDLYQQVLAESDR